MPTQQSATFSTKVRRMFGFSLHDWENAMVSFLVVAGAFALLAGIATWVVVTLQRIELTNARLETERIKTTVAWRTIAPASASELEKVLSAKPWVVNLRWTDNDPEALFLAIQFSQILVKAHWAVMPGALKPDNTIVFDIRIPDIAGVDVTSLRDAFTKAKISFSTKPVPPGNSFSAMEVAGVPLLMIGSRPPPVFP